MQSKCLKFPQDWHSTLDSTLDRLEKKWGNNLTLIFLEQFYLKQLYKKFLLLTLMFKKSTMYDV